MRFLPSTGLWWLSLSSLAIASEIPYDAQIEIDVLFPRNETYNNLTSFPVVLAIQDVKSAYRFEWEISWTMYNVAPGALELDYTSGYGSYSNIGNNHFQWYFDDVAVVPMMGYNFTKMKPGPYRLEWEYYTTPCTNRPPNTIVYNIRQVIASGVQFFSVVEDGSGLDFEIPVGECPAFGDLWAVKESTYLYCPFLRDSDDGDKDPCKAKLQNREQVDCIRDYLFEGTRQVPNNETEACRSAFKRADVAWLEPLSDDGDEDEGNDDGSSDNDDGGSDNDNGGSDNDNGGSDNDDGGSDNDNGGSDNDDGGSSDKQDDTEGYAVSHRPGLFGVAVMGLLAVAAM